MDAESDSKNRKSRGVFLNIVSHVSELEASAKVIFGRLPLPINSGDYL